MQVDTAIIGAGAAGMMCAAHAPGRVVVIDHAKAPGEKIRISGGGRCNFTNLHTAPDRFIGANPHFAKSALARYTQWDFIDLVERHGIAWHEKTLGQLFCDNSAKDIIAMLRKMMVQNGADLYLQTKASQFAMEGSDFSFRAQGPEINETFTAQNLIIATGGKSIPKMGATGLAYEIADQFGVGVTETRAGLVPFTFPDGRFADLSGVSTPVAARAGNQQFDEAMLFTHRGLSGPAMLQISSYWTQGDPLKINLDPEATLLRSLRDQRQTLGRRNLTTELSRHLPARLVDFLSLQHDLGGNLADWSDARLEALVADLRCWSLTPSGTEGYRTAEVTVGGVDTSALSSKTMETKKIPGLYFIGEAVDVAGWLGGYNFQWAWSSAMAAARALS